jgi:hypothetical protein
MVTLTTRWYSDEPDLPPFLKSLDDARRKATQEGWCYQYV